jgi:hypothetical protein
MTAQHSPENRFPVFKFRLQKYKRNLIFYIFLMVFLMLPVACTPQSALPPSTPISSDTQVTTITTTPSLTIAPTKTLTPSPTETITPTTTFTSLPSLSPTYSILRGEVNQEHVSCFYGPSNDYLYKYGLVGGSHLEIIGVLPDTGYIEIRAIGGTNPCWMNLNWMNVEGDINLVQPIDPLDIDLPWSPYYGALSWVTAKRADNEVTITWSPLVLRAGDDSEQEPYLVEAWVCQNGKLVFIPTGTYYTQITLTDEPGCSEPSHGRVYGVEKHGYTPWLKISWPPATSEQ